MSIFLESLPWGFPAVIACIAGFLLGRRLRRPGIIGFALILLSFALFFGGLFAGSMIATDCRSETGHMVLGVLTYAAFPESWLTAFGAGMLAARVWTMSRVGAVVCVAIVALLSAPFSYLAMFSVGFRPWCYV